MSDWKFKDRAQVAQSMQYEGLEYFVTGYSQSSQMPDKETEELFGKAEEAYAEFQEACENLAKFVGINP